LSSSPPRATQCLNLIRTTFDHEIDVINASNLKKAHALIESGRAQGKVVLAGF
jgi:hypothetical protein